MQKGGALNRQFIGLDTKNFLKYLNINFNSDFLKQTTMETITLFHRYLTFFITESNMNDLPSASSGRQITWYKIKALSQISSVTLCKSILEIVINLKKTRRVQKLKITKRHETHVQPATTKG